MPGIMLTGSGVRLGRPKGERQVLHKNSRKMMPRILEDGPEKVAEPDLAHFPDSDPKAIQRIGELEDWLRHAQVIEYFKSGNHNPIAHIGSTVVIQENGMQPETFILVGHLEADSHKRRISNESPLGKVLTGCVAGDKLEIKTPSGVFRVSILDVVQT